MNIVKSSLLNDEVRRKNGESFNKSVRSSSQKTRGEARVVTRIKIEEDLGVDQTKIYNTSIARKWVIIRFIVKSGNENKMKKRMKKDMKERM